MVSASTGAMNSVLSKLATLLEEECDLRTRYSIIALKSALTSMKSFLERRAASTEDMDPLVEGWMNQVRDMTYDLEDYIDDFVRPAAPSDTNWVAQLLKMVKWRRQYTSLLQELKERVSEASERRWRYGIVCDPGNPMPIACDDVPIDGLLPIFNAHQGGGPVCVEGPRDRLIKLLAPDDQQQLKMVSIVGSRGIGKTTLAMEVYQSLKERFHCHTFVLVFRRHDLRMILISILSQISVQEHYFRECAEEKLIHIVREFLKTRRYFIVIEDIWDVSAWKIIRWAFPENDCGSRILVTTCFISIASQSCYFSQDNIFQMPPLSDADARRLFFRRIFHPEYSPPLHLEEISSDILKKCGGVPLAVITIASLLATKSEESEWKRVRDGIDSIVDKSATLDGIKQILFFAYFDLPFHLRTCLLYLAIFPEGYVIDKARLIRRWMAEGFITAEHGKSSQEVGEFYFNELINRGLIQPVCIQYDGRIEACQVQNMIFDIILSKSVEENFVTRSDDSGCTFGVQERIRRLSVYCDYDKECSFIPSPATASHIRSLTIFMTDKKMPTLANFRALRILDLESSGDLKDANYLQSIGKPRLLNYLRLQTTRFIELPEQVVDLQFLQTLDLTRALIKQLPCSIVRLKQLTYLLVKNVKLPEEIGELQVLQELSHVKVVSSNSPNSLEDLGRLTMLKVLGLNWCIRDTDACLEICAKSLISSLGKLGNSGLQSLHIGSGSGCSLDFLLDSLSASFKHLHEFRMTSDYYLSRIPEWMTSIVCLKLLEINIDTLGEEALKILGKLPSLLVLLLSVKSAAPSQGLIIRSYGFQRLLQFDFICWNGLHMVMFEQGSMLALEKLHLKFRAKGVLVYYGFQFGIEHIASLRHLHVDIDCKDAEAREVEAAEDAVRGAISAHPGSPRLELRKLRISRYDQSQQQKATCQLRQPQQDLFRRAADLAPYLAISRRVREANPVSRMIKGEACTPPLAASCDALEALKVLVQRASVAERNLLVDVSWVRDRCDTTRKGKAQHRAVVDGLRALGYDAAVCKSRWDDTPSHRAGEHEYIDTVVGDNVRLIVEVDFRSEFVMPLLYSSMLQALPPLFVGTPDRLEKILAIMTEAAQQNFKKGMQVPRWRKLEYMRRKWLSPHVRIDESNELSTKKESAAIEEKQV